MSSKNSTKKLKMERLSPIPALDRSHLLSDSLHTPVRPAAPPSHLRQKDAYAIEITSSPEFQPPVVTDSSSLQKQRRIRNITRGKVPRKTNSTPLSGLITRKTINMAPKGIHFSDPFSSPTSTDAPSPREELLLSIPEELPQIDDYSPQKPTHSPRHSEMISASAIFPQKPQPSNSNTTALAGIVNKKPSNLNRSLNDSILVLREADDPSDDDEIASNSSLIIKVPKPNAEKVSIESFESPRKTRYVLPNEHTTAARIFKNFRLHHSKNLIRDNGDEASPITENSRSNSGEMCGHERKNRKRALDFNFPDFMVPTGSDYLGDGRESPILNLMPPRHDRESHQSSVLNVTPLYHGPDADCKSPTLNFKSPISRVRSECLSPVLSLKPEKSPVLNLMTPSNLKEENPKSPVLNLTALDRQPEADCRSPALILMPLQHEREGDRPSPTASSKYPSHARDCRSPILNLSPRRHDRENRQSPVLNLTALDREPEADRQSPILIPSSPQCEPDADCKSPILHLKPPKAANLNAMPPSFCSSKACCKPLKPAKCPEIKPHVEKQVEECLSDTDSIIESTPRLSENRNQNSARFTASSYLQIENDSPSSDGKVDYSADEFDRPRIVEILEDTTATKGDEKCDLKFVVVSHDTSSDESVNPDRDQDAEDSADVLFPVIDGRHSPLELNYTKRPIQSFESPSKASKPFSEAVNIGAFGSPDSNTSCGDQQDEDKEDTGEGIEPSTTPEYIEESEQVRPAKRRKKGSLLERVKGVIAKVDASNALFDYEIKCGLRPSKGKFVSAPLVILKKWGESSSVFLVCKPLKYCGNSSHVEDISSYLIVHVSKLPSGICDGSVVLLHFPINVIYFSNLHMPCALAGHQIVLDATKQKIDIRTIDASSLDTIDSFSLAYTKPMTSFKTFSLAQLRTLSEAALCQNLVEESNLYLTVLHVTKLYLEAILMKISVLCSDEESQFCWLEFSSERDVRRATALETLHILSDGSQVQTKGFSVADRVRLDRKSKNLISYCSNNTVNNEMIFSVHPKESTWVISSTEGLSEVKKVRSSVGDILSKKMLGCRYLLEVHGVDKESLRLKDSQGQSIHFVIGENSYLNLDHPVPFFLDGLYFFDDKLFSDEHTRVIPII